MEGKAGFALLAIAYWYWGSSPPSLSDKSRARGNATTNNKEGSKQGTPKK